MSFLSYISFYNKFRVSILFLLHDFFFSLLCLEQREVPGIPFRRPRGGEEPGLTGAAAPWAGAACVKGGHVPASLEARTWVDILCVPRAPAGSRPHPKSSTAPSQGSVTEARGRVLFPVLREAESPPCTENTSSWRHVRLQVAAVTWKLPREGNALRFCTPLRPWHEISFQRTLPPLWGP